MNLENRNEPLVSIIVPVYNAQTYLRDCLDSLLNQDLPSWEILCVNDGSTDSSGEILAEYACQYPQVKVLYQENAGVSAARNHGLQEARGTYISFCDSDDFLMEGLLGMMCRYLTEKNADIGFYNEMWVPEDCRNEKAHVASEADVTVGIDEQIRNTVESVLMLVKREHLDKYDARFHAQIAYAEDALFMIDIMRHMDPEKVIHVHQNGYYHRNTPGSAMNAAKVKRIPRHYKSMRILAVELQERLHQEVVSEAVKQHMTELLNIAVCNALYDGFFLVDRKPEEILRELRADGSYPQPFNRNYLKKRPVKEMVFNYLRFLFPVPLYYSIITRLVRLAMKIKKM